MDFGNREKEKPCIFFTGIVIFQYGVVFRPVGYFEFDQLVFAKERIGNIILFFKKLEDR